MSQKLTGTAHLAALHRALWDVDPWYKWSWFIAPTVAGLALGGLLIAPTPPSAAPWGKPLPGSGAPPTPVVPPVKPSQPQSQTSTTQSQQTQPSSGPAIPPTPSPSLPQTLVDDPRYRTCILAPNSGPPKAIIDGCSFVVQSAGAPPPTKAEAYLNRGLARRRAGETAVFAMKDYDEAIKLHPTYSAAYNNRGMEAIDLGRLDEALADLNKAIEITPHLPQPYFNRARLWNVRKEYDRAIADATEALRRPGPPSHSFIVRAVAYRMKGQFKEEMDDLDEMVRRFPKDEKARVERLAALVRKGDFASTITDGTDAISHVPNSSDLHAMRGEAFFITRKLDQALGDLNEAIKINPNHVNALIVRGRLNNSVGQYDSAIRDGGKAISIAKAFWAYSVRATALINLGRASEAVSDIDAMHKLNPNQPEVYYLYGYAAERDETDLIERCRIARTAPKSSIEAATCSKKVADYGVPIERYTKAISLSANTTRGSNATHIIARSRVYRLNGQLTLSEQDLAQVRTLDPNRWDTQIELGRLASAQNDHRRAVQEYTRSLELDPRSVLALYARARSYALLGERKLAIEGYQAALAIDPKHELSRQGLAALGL